MSRQSKAYRPERPPYADTRQGQGYKAPNPSLSRASYPSFLSLSETVRIQVACAGRGLLDAFRWDTVIMLIASDAEVRTNVLKSMMLNTISLTSIYVFDLLLFPLAQGQRNWLHRNVGWAYQVFWLLPVVGASLYLNSTYCTIIAKRTYTLQHGRSTAAPPATYTGILNALATSAYGSIMIVTSLVVNFALGYIPIIGRWLGFVFACWVDAYYCFEFVWIARGLSLARRIRHLEERWAYSLAFGFPLAATCMWSSSLANAALFALLFPSYIIMAMYARPLPLDPYNPSSSSPDETRHPSPFLPIRLPIFAPVLWLNDAVVRVLSLAGGRAPSHRRMRSDMSESMEEGVGIEMGAVGGKGQGPRLRTRVHGQGSGGGNYAPGRKKLE